MITLLFALPKGKVTFDPVVFSRVRATLQPVLSVGRSVTFYFFYDFISLALQLLPKWSSDLKYGPCPPARDFGSRVSGLDLRKGVTNAAI